MKRMVIFLLLVLCFSSCLVAQIGDIREYPDGVSIQISEGGYQIISVGTGTYDFNDTDDIREAKQDAEKRAKAAIVKFLKEDISTNESLEETSKKVKVFSSENGVQSSNVSKESVKNTMEAIRGSAAGLLTGVVVLQSAKVPGNGNAGEYRVMVGTSSKTREASQQLDNAIAATLNQAQPAVAGNVPQANDAVAQADNAANNGETNVAEGALPPGWIVCVGDGTDRRSAVQQALVEGISQVYGQAIQNDERMSERMTKFKANARLMGGEVSAVGKVSDKSNQNDTLTKTAGFVKEYRVIKVVPKDEMLEATVYAHLVNPRAGETVALRICSPTMAISMKTNVYQLGPKRRMSGAEVGKAILTALPNGLLNTNKFLIINDDSIANVLENKELAADMAAAGIANASEVLLAGQGLTPDFSIRTEVTDIAYSKKLALNKATNKLEPQYKMHLKLNLSLTNDRTGQLVKSDALTLVLESEEIATLLEEDEEADLLQAILGKLAGPIETWIAAGN